jgi:sigma-B regulation protein RsbU (phosphoserine phosphatase)
MATYSVPFYRLIQHRRTFMGVVTADVSLEGLVELISRLLPERMGFAFLISRNGVFLSHPNKAYPMQESIFSIAEANADEELRRVGRQMIEGGEGFVPVDKSFTGQRSWMYYAPLPSVGWSIGLVFPESTLFAEITLLTRNVVAIGATGFLLLFVAIIVISGAITAPPATGGQGRGNCPETWRSMSLR